MRSSYLLGIFLLVIGSVHAALICSSIPTLTPTDDSSENNRDFTSLGAGVIPQNGLLNFTGTGGAASPTNAVFNCSNFSVSFKARPASLVSAGALLHNDYVTSARFQRGWQVRHGAGAPAQMLVCISNYTATDCPIDISPSTSTVAGTEYVWGITYNSSSGALRGFKNGVFVSSANRPNMNLSTNPFQLGTTTQYNGTLDDVYLWCGTLSDSEIGAFQQNGTVPSSTPVWANFEFKNQSSCYLNGVAVPQSTYIRPWLACSNVQDLTPLQDASGNGNTLDAYLLLQSYNASSASYELGGSTGYLTSTLGSANSAFNLTNAFSISLWAKIEPVQPETASELVIKWGGSGPYPFTMRYANSTKHVQFGVYNGTTNPSALYAGGFNDSVWHHFVGVYNVTHLLFYSDGVLRQTTTNTLTGQINNSVNMSVGRRLSSTKAAFNGSIDDIRFFLGTALNSTQVASLYANQTVSDGLVAQYTFQNTTTCQVMT